MVTIPLSMLLCMGILLSCLSFIQSAGEFKLNTNTVLLPTIQGTYSASYILYTNPPTCVEWSIDYKSITLTSTITSTNDHSSSTGTNGLGGSIISPIILQPFEYPGIKCPNKKWTDRALILANSTTLQKDSVKILVQSKLQQPIQTLEVEVFLSPIARLEIGTKTERLLRGSDELIDLYGWDKYNNMFTSLEGLPFRWSIYCKNNQCNERIFPKDLKHLGTIASSTDTVPLSFTEGEDNLASRILRILPLSQTSIEISSLRKAIEEHHSYVIFNGTKVSLVADHYTTAVPPTETLASSISATIRPRTNTNPPSNQYADTIVIRGGDRSGRIIVCASTELVRTCRALVVQEKLRIQPPGNLHLAPGTQLQMQLWYTHPLNHREQRLPLPDTKYSWIINYPSLLNFATVHNGILDTTNQLSTVATIPTYLMMLDMDLQNNTAKELVSYCNQENNSVETYERLPCNDTSGGIITKVTVVEPAFITLWLEPALRIPSYKKQLAALQRNYNPSDDGTIVHLSSVGLDEPDYDYSEHDSLTKISPWVQLVRGSTRPVQEEQISQLLQAKTVPEGAGVYVCNGYSTDTCVVKDTIFDHEPLHLIQDHEYILHTHVVGTNGARLVAGENVRVRMKIQDDTPDITLGDGRTSDLFVAPYRSDGLDCAQHVSRKAVNDNVHNTTAVNAIPTVYSITSCDLTNHKRRSFVTVWSADEHRWSIVFSEMDTYVPRNEIIASIDARLPSIVHPTNENVHWFPTGTPNDGSFLWAYANVVSQPALALEWPKITNKYEVQALGILYLPSDSPLDTLSIPNLVIAAGTHRQGITRIPLVVSGNSSTVINSRSNSTIRYTAIDDLELSIPTSTSTVCTKDVHNRCLPSVSVHPEQGILTVNGIGDTAITAVSTTDTYNGVLLLASVSNPETLFFPMNRFLLNLGETQIIEIRAKDRLGRTFDICRHIETDLQWSTGSIAESNDNVPGGEVQIIQATGTYPSYSGSDDGKGNDLLNQVSDQACGYVMLKGTSVGMAKLTVSYLNGISTTLTIDIYHKLRIVYPFTDASVDTHTISIAHGSSLSVLLTGGPQVFPSKTHQLDARTAVNEVSKGVQFGYCLHNASLPDQPCPTTAVNGITASLAPLKTKSFSTMVETIFPVWVPRSQENLGLVDEQGGIQRHDFTEPSLTYSPRQKVLTSLYALRITCSNQQLLNGDVYRISFDVSTPSLYDTPSVSRQRVALKVHCVLPVRAHTVVLRDDAYAWDRALPSITHSTPSYVLTNENIMQAIYFTSINDERIYNVTGSLDTEKLSVSFLNHGVQRSIVTPQSTDLLLVNLSTRFPTVSDTLRTATNVPDILDAYVPSIQMFSAILTSGSTVDPAATASMVNNRRYWRRRALEGNVLLPGKTYNHIGMQTLRIDIPYVNDREKLKLVVSTKAVRSFDKESECPALYQRFEEFIRYVETVTKDDNSMNDLCLSLGYVLGYPVPTWIQEGKVHEICSLITRPLVYGETFEDGRGFFQSSCQDLQRIFTHGETILRTVRPEFQYLPLYSLVRWLVQPYTSKANYNEDKDAYRSQRDVHTLCAELNTVLGWESTIVTPWSRNEGACGVSAVLLNSTIDASSLMNHVAHPYATPGYVPGTVKDDICSLMAVQFGYKQTALAIRSIGEQSCSFILSLLGDKKRTSLVPRAQCESVARASDLLSTSYYTEESKFILTAKNKTAFVNAPECSVLSSMLAGKRMGYTIATKYEYLTLPVPKLNRIRCRLAADMLGDAVNTVPLSSIELFCPTFLTELLTVSDYAFNGWTMQGQRYRSVTKDSLDTFGVRTATANDKTIVSSGLRSFLRSLYHFTIPFVARSHELWTSSKLFAHTTIAIVTPAVPLPTVPVMYTQPDVTYEIRCVGGTGAIEFTIGSNNNNPERLTQRRLRTPTTVATKLVPIVAPESTLVVSPTGAESGTVPITCRDTFLPGALSRGITAVLDVPTKINLAVHRFIPKGDVQPLFLTITTPSTHVPFPSAQYHHMGLTFELSSASSSPQISRTGKEWRTVTNTNAEIFESVHEEVCTDEETDSLNDAIVAHTFGTGLCPEFQYFFRAKEVGTVQVRAYLDYGQGVSSTVTSVNEYIEIYEPLTSIPPKLVLVPDAMLRLEIHGGPVNGAQDFVYVYRSHDINIATVSADGMVAAVGQGETVITVELVDAFAAQNRLHLSDAAIIYGRVDVPVNVTYPSRLQIIGSGGSRDPDLSASIIIGGEPMRFILTTPEGHTPQSFSGKLVNAQIRWNLANTSVTKANDDLPTIPWFSDVSLSAVSIGGHIDTGLPMSAWILAKRVENNSHTYLSAILEITTRGQEKSFGGTVITNTPYADTRIHGKVKLFAEHVVAVIPRLRFQYPYLDTEIGHTLTVPPLSRVQLQMNTDNADIKGIRYNHYFTTLNDNNPFASSIQLNTEGDLRMGQCSDDGSTMGTILVKQTVEEDGFYRGFTPAQKRLLRLYPSQTLSTRLQCLPIARIALATNQERELKPATHLDVPLNEEVRRRIVAVDVYGRVFSIGLSSLCAAYDAPVCTPALLGIHVYSSDNDTATASLVWEDNVSGNGAFAVGGSGPRAGHEEDLLLVVTGRTVGSSSIHVFAPRGVSRSSVNEFSGDFTTVTVSSIIEPSGTIAVMTGAMVKFNVTSHFLRKPEHMAYADILKRVRWNASDTEKVSIDAMTGAVIARREGSVRIRAWIDMNTNNKQDKDEPNLDTTTLHIVSGEKITVTLQNITFDSLVRLGAGMKVDFTDQNVGTHPSNALSVSDRWVPSNQEVPVLTVVDPLLPPAPTVFRLRLRTLPIEGVVYTVEDTLSIKQNIQFACEDAVTDTLNRKWFRIHAVGPGGNDSMTEWKPKYKDTHLEAYQNWIQVLNPTEPVTVPSLYDRSSQLLTAPKPTERICMIIPVTVPRPSYANDYSFSLLPSTGRSPHQLHLQATVTSLRSEDRVKLSLSTDLEQTKAGYTYRGARTVSDTLYMNFLPSLRLVPQSSVAIHIKNERCGLTFKDMKDYDKVPDEAKGIVLADQDIVLTIQHTHQPFVLFVYGDVASKGSLTSVSSLVWETDPRLSTVFIPKVSTEQLTKTVIQMGLSSIASLIQSSCTCVHNENDTSGICPSGVVLVYVRNMTTSVTENVDVQIHGEITSVIGTRTPLSFTNAMVKVIHPGTNQEVSLLFAYNDTLGGNSIDIVSTPKESTEASVPSRKPSAVPTIPTVETQNLEPKEEKVVVPGNGSAPTTTAVVVEDTDISNGLGTMEIIVLVFAAIVAVIFFFMSRTEADVPVPLATNQAQFQAVPNTDRDQTFANFNRTMY